MAGIMSLLFGKKRRRVGRKRKSSKKSKSLKKPKALTYSLRLLAKKYKVKTRIVRNGKHVGYRKVSHIKRDIRRKQRKHKRASKFGRSTRRHRRSSSFGVGGSYMPLSSFMSPYPYSVDSSPPWI